MAGVETVFYRKHGELIVIRSAEEEFKGNATTQPLYRKPDLPQFYSPPPPLTAVFSLQEGSGSRTNMLVRISVTQKQRSHKHRLTCAWPQTFSSFLSFLFFSKASPKKLFENSLDTLSQSQKSSTRKLWESL